MTIKRTFSKIGSRISITLEKHIWKKEWKSYRRQKVVLLLHKYFVSVWSTKSFIVDNTCLQCQRTHARWKRNSIRDQKSWLFFFFFNFKMFVNFLEEFICLNCIHLVFNRIILRSVYHTSNRKRISLIFLSYINFMYLNTIGRVKYVWSHIFYVNLWVFHFFFFHFESIVQKRLNDARRYFIWIKRIQRYFGLDGRQVFQRIELFDFVTVTSIVPLCLSFLAVIIIYII